MRPSNAQLAVSFVLLLGCGAVAEAPTEADGDEPWDPQPDLAGEGGMGAGGVDASGPRPDQQVTPGDPPAGSDSSDAGAPHPTPAPTHTGTWTGYAENHQFPSGSDAITVTFDAFDASAITGHVVFGPGPAAAAPDPNSVLLEALGYNPYGPQENYAYSLVDASLEGERLRFSIVPLEVWNGFCASFPPIVDEINEGQFGCIPNWAFTSDGTEQPGACYLTNPMTGQNEEFDCAQYQFCHGVLGICECDASACATTEFAAVVTFDVVVGESAMDGSVDGLSGLHNVHLKRAPN
jgi:hypothetical protein